MPVYDPQMTAQKAEASLPRDVDAMYINATQRKARGRIAPPVLEVVEELKKQKIHLFNVGPWAHLVPCGSAGTFTFPACPDDKEYVEMTQSLSVIEDELVIASEKEYKRLQDSGHHIALEILGEGRGRDARYSLRHVGVFIAKGEKPTKEEIKEAKNHLYKHCAEIVQDMRTMWDIDRKLAHDVMSPKVHMTAARVLNLTDEPWMVQSNPQQSIRCPYCRTNIEPEAAICHNCKNITNPQEYANLKMRESQVIPTAAPRSRQQ